MEIKVRKELNTSQFQQLSALFSKEVMRAQKRYGQNSFLFVIVSLVGCVTIFGSHLNPMLFPIIAGSFCATDNSMGIISNFLQDRTTKFRGRVKLLGVSELVYLSSPVLIRLCFACTQFGLSSLFHFTFSTGSFGMFSDISILLLTSSAYVCYVLSSFAFYMTISLFIRDAKTMFRIFPMIIGLSNIYPSLSTFINNNIREVQIGDFIYAILTPQGCWYIFNKEMFLQYNYNGYRPLMIFGYMIFQTLLLWGINYVLSRFFGAGSGGASLFKSSSFFKSKNTKINPIKNRQTPPTFDDDNSPDQNQLKSGLSIKNLDTIKIKHDKEDIEAEYLNKKLLVHQEYQGMSNGDLENFEHEKDFLGNSSNSGLSGKNSLVYSRNHQLIIENLTKKYGDFSAVDDISLQLQPGLITCLLGHNGAGKTTLINTILGVEEPSSGNIVYQGVDIHENPELLSGKIGYCSAEECLYPNFTVSEFLLFLAYLKGVPEPHDHIKSIIQNCNLEDYADQIIEKLSGGTRKRTSLATSLIGDPLIIFLDEPSSGVDVANRKDVWTFLRSLITPDRVILLTTHQLEEAEQISQDIIIMHKGTVDVRGTPLEITNRYGIGYQITISKLASQEAKQSILEKLKEKDENIKIYEGDFQSKARVTLTLSSQTGSLLKEAVSILEDGNFEFSVKANSLVQAFINLGESKKSAQDVERTKNLYSKLMGSKYPIKWGRVPAMLVYRRVQILIGNPENWLRVLYMMIVPAVITIIVQRKSKFEGRTILMYFLFCVQTAGSAFLMFSSVPFEERISRRRYLLKLVGVDSVSYFLCLLFVDFLILSSIIPVGFILLCIMNIGEDFSFLFSSQVFNLLFSLICMLFWELGFLSSSYKISQFVNDPEKGLNNMTRISFWGNIGGFPLLILVVGLYLFLNFELLGILITILITIFPNYGIITICAFRAFREGISSALKDRNIPVKDSIIYWALGGLISSSIFYISMSILHDFHLNSSGSSQINSKKSEGKENEEITDLKNFQEENLSMVVSGLESKLVTEEDKKIEEIDENTKDHIVVNKNEISQEEEMALKVDSSLPIQGYKISKQFKKNKKKFYALKDVSLVLEKSQTLGLLGPNGAGKSTLFNILSTYYKVDEGKMIALGSPITSFSRLFQKTGLCSQDDILWRTFTVKQHMAIFQILYSIPTTVVEHWLELFELKEFKNLYPHELSSGMKRKLCFILSAVSNPLYKFLDEPTSAVDPVTRLTFQECIRQQQNCYGASSIFTTHTMEEAEKMCDKIVVLVNGQISALGTPDHLKKYCAGFELVVEKLDDKQSPQEVQNAMEKFIDIIEWSKVRIEEVGDKLITFMIDHDLQLSKLLEQLEISLQEGAFKEYKVSHQGLENLFFKLSGLQKKINDKKE